MNDELRDLKERISTLSSEELWQMVNTDFADYRKEALDLAKESLRKRGHAQSQTNALLTKQPRKAPNVANDQMSTMRFTIFSVATGLVTLFLFPVISYTSIIVYGLPASVFMMIGYELWFILRRFNPRMASAFGIGFIPPVVFCLMFLSFGAPSYIGMILLQFFVFWIIHKFLTISWSGHVLR